MHGSCLVSCAAPVAIVYKIKTRNACTTFLNSSAYLVVLGLHALLLNRPHLECVSESGCSSLCQLRSKNERTHLKLTTSIPSTSSMLISETSLQRYGRLRF